MDTHMHIWARPAGSEQQPTLLGSEDLVRTLGRLAIGFGGVHDVAVPVFEGLADLYDEPVTVAARDLDGFERGRSVVLAEIDDIATDGTLLRSKDVGAIGWFSPMIPVVVAEHGDARLEVVAGHVTLVPEEGSPIDVYVGNQTSVLDTSTAAHELGDVEQQVIAQFFDGNFIVEAIEAASLLAPVVDELSEAVTAAYTVGADLELFIQ